MSKVANITQGDEGSRKPGLCEIGRCNFGQQLWFSDWEEIAAGMLHFPEGKDFFEEFVAQGEAVCGGSPLTQRRFDETGNKGRVFRRFLLGIDL